jgi:hypothetical protein
MDHLEWKRVASLRKILNMLREVEEIWEDLESDAEIKSNNNGERTVQSVHTLSELYFWTLSIVWCLKKN